MNETVFQILLLLFLGAVAYMDLKQQEISVIYTAAGFLTGIFLQIFFGGLQVYEIAGGCLLGGFVLLIAFLSRQAIGYGDGFVLIVTGAFLGVLDNMILLLVALVLAAGTGVVLLFLIKRSRKKRMPFLPFLFTGYLLILAVV